MLAATRGRSPEQPAGICPVARRSGQPADGPGGRQPRLADALRQRAGERRKTSERRASGPAIRSCSTGWRPSSSARGWDVKALDPPDRDQRDVPAIVAASRGKQIERDPENRLLARGPRLRLPAEMIRDQALAASGLLVERIGGPSVKPYQPPGLWNELAGADIQSRIPGPSLYRRSLYTFWKRTVAPPAMVAFDASGARDVHRPRDRGRTRRCRPSTCSTT